MVLFPFRAARLRGAPQRRPKLPLYEKVGSRIYDSPNNSDKDDESSFSDDYSSDEEDSSRQTSSDFSASAYMIPKHVRQPVRRPHARPHLYRLPNRVIKCLCFLMISGIVLFILALVRASQVENLRLAQGGIGEILPAPPPIWENFRFLQRYYGGMRSLVAFEENVPEYPRAEDNVGIKGPGLTQRDLAASLEFPAYPGAALDDGIKECFLDVDNTVRVPPLRYFNGRPSGFPEHVLGSYEVLGLPEDICFERYGKLGPYGLGYSTKMGGLGVGKQGDQGGAEAVWESTPEVDFRKINWADVQRQCYRTNKGRYKLIASKNTPAKGFYIDDGAELEWKPVVARDEPTSKSSGATTSTHKEINAEPAHGPSDLPRTAVVLRCWDEFVWREDDIMNVRSLISELSLASGGRYDIHILVQVKDDAKYPIWADEATYHRRIIQTVPPEFRALVTLWSTTQMLALYQGVHDVYARGPDLPIHGVYRGLQMAMQHFAVQHPEYEHFWHWEMDIRYTGHYLDLFTKLEAFARQEPRKGLWERSGRFYVPSVHGSWDDFGQMARVQSEMGATGADNVWNNVPGIQGKQKQQTVEKPVWGPLRPKSQDDWFETQDDPVPPTSHEKDHYEWGVGEEADLITLSPIFDPEGTSWGLAADITGYNLSSGLPPRRAQIIASSRMSRRLLVTMHRETAFKKHFAFSEMWPATAALHHGLKAVYAHHPVYVDREWPTEYLAQVLNGGKNGAVGGSRSSVYGEREHNLRGLTWFYNSGFSGNLYNRWLGNRVNNDGGEGFETSRDDRKGDTSVGDMKGGEGRMCLPPMLLHPVKNVLMDVEINQDAVEVPESDPSA